MKKSHQNYIKSGKGLGYIQLMREGIDDKNVEYDYSYLTIKEIENFLIDIFDSTKKIRKIINNEH